MKPLCPKCEKPMLAHLKERRCKHCGTACECGNPKDWRANHCKACANHYSAMKQWGHTEQRKRIIKAIVKSARKTRRKYEDLTLETFNHNSRTDGRRFAHYWDEAGKKRAIYRYQWVWRQANGPIPPGGLIHHKNEDRTDDRLENLELMFRATHARLHMDKEQMLAMNNARGVQMTGKTEYTCKVCDSSFMAYPRGNGEGRSYCSKRCLWNRFKV